MVEQEGYNKDEIGRLNQELEDIYFFIMKGWYEKCVEFSLYVDDAYGGIAIPKDPPAADREYSTTWTGTFG